MISIDKERSGTGGGEFPLFFFDFVRSPEEQQRALQEARKKEESKGGGPRPDEASGASKGSRRRSSVKPAAVKAVALEVMQGFGKPDERRPKLMMADEVVAAAIDTMKAGLSGEGASVHTAPNSEAADHGLATSGDRSKGGTVTDTTT